MKDQSATLAMPRWYQDLSIPQMKNVFSLGDIIRADYDERVTGRTRRALGDIGVTSTFVKITPEQIKKSRRTTDLDPVKFLCEIYRTVTGTYFTDEEYKKTYDCNERIILSAIAFLTLPETVIELHRRLPMGVSPKLPPKPLPQKIEARQKAASPYLEPLFTRPDWLTYKKELYLWRKQCEETPIPRAILPSSTECLGMMRRRTSAAKSREDDGPNEEELQSTGNESTDEDSDHEIENIDKDLERVRKPVKNDEKSRQQHRHSSFFPQGKKNDDENEETHKSDRKKTDPGKRRGSSHASRRNSEIDERTRDQRKSSVGRRETGKQTKRKSISQKKPATQDRVRKRKKSSEDKGKSRRSSASHSRSRQRNQSQNEIDDARLEKTNTSREVRPDKQPLLDGKETHLILRGATGYEDSKNFPVSQETSGIACVTPYNSDESFFKALHLVEPKKSYPRGRDNLSRNWQEWFRAVDEDFIKVEKEADKILKSVEGTLKIMSPEVTCDACCTCRQTKKANLKYHKTKTPRMVIDSVAGDGKRNKYVVGSLAMNSPAPSPSESVADLPEVIESHEEMIKNKIISGVINEKGQFTYYIAGVGKEVEHVPRKITKKSAGTKSIRNVPPCGCAIEKMINEGLTEILSDDNILWTKGDQLCIGRKYRPNDVGAISCRDYPGDRACRRNPFKKKIDQRIQAKLRESGNIGKESYPPEEKNMYSLAAFQPCGDEDGMAVCGGPWGALNVPDEEELARREAEAKLIRESPPCGDKPGRAICGAPFGSRHPVPKKPKRDDEDDEEEDLEEEEPEEKKRRVREPRRKAAETKVEKQLNRDNHCSTVTDVNEREKSKNGHPGVASKVKHNHQAKITRGTTKRRTSKNNETPVEESENFENNTPEESRIPDKEIMRIRNESKNLMKQWNRMKTMASKFVTSTVVFPEDTPRKCTREAQPNHNVAEETLHGDESLAAGPFGRRTASEEALPAEKTLMYLVDPDEPMEKIPVRPGGKPCKCRENRNARKKLLYNVTGVARDGKSKRDEKFSRVIDGLIYITPVPSVRNSEEYIAEYELYESPYEKCSRKRNDDNFKYIERYLGPKSLMKKQPKRFRGCEGSSMPEKAADPPRQGPDNDETERTQKEPLNFGGKKWSKACEDQGLVEFYARCRDNVPCWLRCVEFSKYGCCVSPRRLQVKRPVCECKYERKILRREEEKKNWLNRQDRLRSHKKQACVQVEGLSRPIQTETKLIISDVKKLYRQDQSDDDVVQYCVDGIKEDRIMGPGECVLTGIGMITPVRTPDPSKQSLPIPKEHRHWSPMDVRGPATIRGDEEFPRSKRLNGDNEKYKTNEVTDKRVDVLFQNGQVTKDHPAIKKVHTRVDKSLGKDRYRGSKVKDNEHYSKGKDDSRNRKRKDSTIDGKGKNGDRQRKGTVHMRNDKENYDEPHSEDVITKKVPEREQERTASPEAQAHEYKSDEADRDESVKKTSEIDLRQGNKANEHKTKSTESIELQMKNSLSNKAHAPGVSKQFDLTKLMRIELDKMAEEGFLFAKLPACHQMPQLQYWIMYREGFALSPEEKKNLMERSVKTWSSMEGENPKKIKAPPLDMPSEVLKNLDWDKADRVKREVASKRALFYSNLRKSRVLRARNMWALMEFGKFPSVSFKRAYFTYHASKESDGFVFKPWENVEKSDDKK